MPDSPQNLSEDQSEIRKPPYAFSTGPTSPEGRAVSSLNATKHGCCSHQLLLPDEDEQEWLALRESWFDDYIPHSHTGRVLVHDAALSHWLLLRARRRFYQAEYSNFLEQPDALLWSDAQHQKIDRFTRYRTTAERSFTRALNNLERLRKSRLQEADRLSQRELQAARIEARREESDRRALDSSQREKAPAPKPNPFGSHNSRKKQKEIITLEQWIEITVEDGKTVTTLYPSNEELLKEGRNMDPPPDLVYRRFNFIGPIPPEYAWTTSKLERLESGGFGTQRMTPETWLQLIEREKSNPDGLLSPTGVGNLPRPKERGGCECESCARNREILENIQNENTENAAPEPSPNHSEP